jgi:predicted nucleic-acid-binding Zn-ribbon protein
MALEEREAANAMKQTHRCPKCNSSEIIANARAIDRADGNANLDMTVATYRNPEALIFKGMQNTTISAWVCAGCGYIEYYADNPRELLV